MYDSSVYKAAHGSRPKQTDNPGKELYTAHQEFVFIPQKVAERLKEYVKENCPEPEEEIFKICYESARSIVRKAGNQVGIKLRPHDLRRHAATHAS